MLQKKNIQEILSPHQVICAEFPDASTLVTKNKAES